MASSAIAGALTTGFWAGTIGSITYGAIAGAIGGALVSGVISGALADTPDQPDFGSDGASRGILLNKAANDAQIPVVYGQRKVGGTRVFMGVTGSDNEYLHLVLALAEGEIDSVQNV
jgi:predicted phage tail protein